jgi:hypothetical protein
MIQGLVLNGEVVMSLEVQVARHVVETSAMDMIPNAIAEHSGFVWDS